jgi:hypothetical protein
MLVGSCCDRGQVYCTGDCAKKARRQSMREAGRRYQASKKGRLAHAARQRKYREQKRLMAQQVTTVPAQSAGPAAARHVRSHLEIMDNACSDAKSSVRPNRRIGAPGGSVPNSRVYGAGKRK